jgi:ribosomal protein L24E
MGVEMKLHTCLTSTLDGGRSGHFTSGEISLGTYWTEAWISPGAGLDVVAKTNNIMHILKSKCNRALSLGAKEPERETDHSPPSSAEVKECVELYLHSPIRLLGVMLS